MSGTQKNFVTDSPIPNWPKPNFLNKKSFSKYCESVTQAIMDGLKMDKKDGLLKKFIYKRDELTQEEVIDIISSYSKIVDIILMKSGF